MQRFLDYEVNEPQEVNGWVWVWASSGWAESIVGGWFWATNGGWRVVWSDSEEYRQRRQAPVDHPNFYGDSDFESDFEDDDEVSDGWVTNQVERSLISSYAGRSMAAAAA